jgi:hypothetical protein
MSPPLIRKLTLFVVIEKYLHIYVLHKGFYPKIIETDGFSCTRDATCNGCINEEEHRLL